MFSAQAFISYSHSQFYFAESLVVSLGRQGIPTWFDNRNLTPGTHWSEALQANLSHSSHFVLVASRESLGSAYVTQEWRTAIAQRKRIIIVYFEAVALPPELQSYPQIAFQGDFEPAVTRLIDVLRFDRPIKEQPVKTWLPNGSKSVFWSLLTVSGITALLMSVLAILGIVVFFQLDSREAALLTSLQNDEPGAFKITGNVFLTHFFHTGGSLMYGIIGSSLFFVTMLLVVRRRLNFPSLLRGLQLAPGTLGFISFLIFLFVIHPPALIGWFGFFLLIAFIAFGIVTSRRARRSPDVLRWMQTGTAPDEIRRRLHFPQIYRPIALANLPLRHWQLLSANDADAKVVAQIRHEFLQTPNLRESSGQQTDWRVVILGSQTLQSWVDKFHRHQPNTVYVITSNVRIAELGPEIQSSQWFDFRSIDNSESLATFLSQGYAGNTMTPIPLSLETFRVPLGVENSYMFLITGAIGFGLAFISTLLLNIFLHTGSLTNTGFGSIMFNIMFTYVNPALSLFATPIFAWIAYKLLHRDISLRRFLLLFMTPIFVLVAANFLLVVVAFVNAGTASPKNALGGGLLFLLALFYALGQLILPATLLFALVWFRKDVQRWLPATINPQVAGQQTLALPGWYVPRYEAFIVALSMLLAIFLVCSSLVAPSITYLK